MCRLVMTGFILAAMLALAGCDNHSTSKSVSPSRGAAGGLVGWWKFDESGGDTAADSSGKGNNGTVLNGAWAQGKFGNALQMDGGNNSIVVVPLSDSLRSTADNVTVMGWAYRTAEHNVDIFGHGYPSLFLGFHGPKFKWQVVNDEGSDASCYANKKYRAVLNQWFHLAGTYDGRMARLYVDGVEICSTWSWRSGPVAMPDAPFTLSGYLNDKGGIVDEITGKIDDVRIYNRVLSADEIRNVFNARK